MGIIKTLVLTMTVMMSLSQAQAGVSCESKLSGPLVRQDGSVEYAASVSISGVRSGYKVYTSVSTEDMNDYIGQGYLYPDASGKINAQFLLKPEKIYSFDVGIYSVKTGSRRSMIYDCAILDTN